MSEIIRLNQVKKRAAPQPMTAVSGAPPDGATPMFETTLLETLAIRKFVQMSIDDIRTQLALAAKDGTPRKLFLAQKQNAFVITAWLTSALMMVDGMLAECATTTGNNDDDVA